ncbi:MAG TPA: hypothetical protein VNS63_19770 [Blastocatellia bacterium]|nr:hypothetical protein [Blastocatellia bacterium]
MKSTVLTLILVLSFVSDAGAQKRKTPAAKKKPVSQKSSPPVETSAPRIIGSTVFVETKNGDRISGELLDLKADSIRLRSDNVESTISLDTIAQLAFGDPVDVRPRVTQSQARADFLRDANVMLGQFTALISSLKSGGDYNEYGRQLGEVRRSAERFIAKYSSGDNSSEARVLSLMAGAMTDYTWARTIWTLKFGRSSDGTAIESDSPVLADAVALYPDVRAVAATGEKLSIDKVIGGLWRKAADNIERARSLCAPAR